MHGQKTSNCYIHVSNIRILKLTQEGPLKLWWRPEKTCHTHTHTDTRRCWAATFTTEGVAHYTSRPQ